MDKFLGQVKAIAGAVVGFVVYLVGVGGFPPIDPFDKVAWLLFLVAGLAGYLGVYVAPTNKLPTKKLVEQAKAADPFAKREISAAIEAPGL